MESDEAMNSAVPPVVSKSTPWLDVFRMAASAKRSLSADQMKEELYDEMKCGNASEVKLILQESGSAVNTMCTGRRFYHAFHDAAGQGHSKVIKVLIKYYNANVEQRDGDGMCALHHAVSKDQRAVIKLLNKAGADMNARDDRMRTSLHIAVDNGCRELVKLLLKLNCLPNAQDSDCRTALYYAIEKDRIDLVTLLIEHKADATITDKLGFNALHLAVDLLKGNVKILSTLLTKLPQPCNIDGKTNEGLTCLHIGSLRNHVDAVELLIRQGKANVNIQNRDGQTPLHVAVVNGHLLIVRLLLRKCCKLDIQDKYGNTPMHYAVGPPSSKKLKECSDDNGIQHTAYFLLGSGADLNLNLKNNEGCTPLELCNDEEFCKLMKKYQEERNKTEPSQ